MFWMYGVWRKRVVPSRITAPGGKGSVRRSINGARVDLTAVAETAATRSLCPDGAGLARFDQHRRTPTQSTQSPKGQANKTKKNRKHACQHECTLYSSNGDCSLFVFWQFRAVDLLSRVCEIP